MAASQFGSDEQDDGELDDPMEIDQVNLDSSPGSATSTGVGGGQIVPVVAMPTYQDRDYFRLLANVHSTYPIASTASLASSPPESPNRTSSPDPFSTPSIVADHRHPPNANSNTSAASTTPTSPTPGVNATSFNQGYYSRFFHELGKLGRGAHGAVYLCRHVLDDIPLGEYAIKKVAVGNNHPWLSRLLREVTLLERLRHPNIIAYKHAWLEHAQHSTFGPLVPSLFILMERANGGNLEDFLLPEGEEAPEPAAAAGGGKAAAVKARKRAARVSALPKLPAAWAEIGTEGGWAVGQHGRIVRVLGTKSVVKLVLGVARGLEHLHKLGVVHRDLKPPNILLSWESDQGIPAGATGAAEGTSPAAEAGQDDGVVPQDSLEPGAVPPTNKIPIPLIADFGEFDVISNPTAPTAQATQAPLISLHPNVSSATPSLAASSPHTRPRPTCVAREILSCNPTSLVGEMAAGVNPQRVPKAFMALIAQCLSKEPGQRPTAGKVVHVLERILAHVEGASGTPVETQSTRRGRSNTYAASGTRSASARKTTWDFGDLQPAADGSETTLRNRTHVRYPPAAHAYGPSLPLLPTYRSSLLQRLFKLRFHSQRFRRQLPLLHQHHSTLGLLPARVLRKSQRSWRSRRRCPPTFRSH
ncbi:kinase-like domain-containing protein [Catenaria anguillulae PL171]|uniref:non-specific serine/threonine protein kinase n=1 Tax=Catenaria anguillulae PL171 TaxID=765915 RepID=A0A1Y2HS87_9FUNG|nr:kinase-like domain-containing protein [Catenaria anguillulae PL171]